MDGVFGGFRNGSRVGTRSDEIQNHTGYRFNRGYTLQLYGTLHTQVTYTAVSYRNSYIKPKHKHSAAFNN